MASKEENVEVLYNKETLNKRIKEIAAEISKDNQGKDTVLVCILKGAFLFAADLCREISIPVEIDFMTASSYEGKSSTGEVKISSGVPTDYKGKNVIIVEDIIDTGLTLLTLKKEFEKKGANSVKTATLLSKKASRQHEVIVDYIGFDIDDLFVVGYGLDYNQRYRDLPYIGIYKG